MCSKLEMAMCQLIFSTCFGFAIYPWKYHVFFFEKIQRRITCRGGDRSQRGRPGDPRGAHAARAHGSTSCSSSRPPFAYKIVLNLNFPRERSFALFSIQSHRRRGIQSRALFRYSAQKGNHYRRHLHHNIRLHDYA